MTTEGRGGGGGGETLWLGHPKFYIKSDLNISGREDRGEKNNTAYKKMMMRGEKEGLLSRSELDVSNGVPPATMAERQAADKKFYGNLHPKGYRCDVKPHCHWGRKGYGTKYNSRG